MVFMSNFQIIHITKYELETTIFTYTLPYVGYVSLHWCVGKEKCLIVNIFWLKIPIDQGGNNQDI